MVNSRNIYVAATKDRSLKSVNISLEATKHMWNDFHSHSEVHACEDVFRFGFHLLIRANSVKLLPIQERVTFDEEPK